MKKELIEEYKELTATCSNTDYSNKTSVRLHNKSTIRMYKIVDEISKAQEQLNQFIELLNVTDNKTNVWVAIQMLEKLSIDSETEAKALTIIRAEYEGSSVDSLGYQIWLNDRTAKKK